MMLFDGHTLGLRQAVVVTAVGVAKSVLLCLIAPERVSVAKEQLGIKSTLGAVVVCQKIGNHVPVSGCDI
jgi:hypothetical protein